MIREYCLWHIRGGPKNGGHFAYLDGRRLSIGINHRPMTKNARIRYLRLRLQQERKNGYARNR